MSNDGPSRGQTNKSRAYSRVAPSTIEGWIVAAAWTLFVFFCVLIPTCGLAIGLDRLGMPASLAYVLGGLVFLAYVRSRRERIDVGPDGLSIRGWGRQRFVPIEAIHEVSQVGGEVTVRLDEAAGRGGDILFTQDFGSVADFARTLRTFVEMHQRVPSSTLLGLLDRGERSVAQWANALRAIVPKATAGGADGYRVAGIPREDLWQLLEEASTPATVRIAAAVALEPTVGTDRARLRAQIGTSVLPAFNQGIQSVLDDPGHVEESLAAVDEETAKLHACR